MALGDTGQLWAVLGGSEHPLDAVLLNRQCLHYDSLVGDLRRVPSSEPLVLLTLPADVWKKRRLLAVDEGASSQRPLPHLVRPSGSGTGGGLLPGLASLEADRGDGTFGRLFGKRLDEHGVRLGDPRRLASVDPLLQHLDQEGVVLRVLPAVMGAGVNGLLGPTQDR